MEIIYVKLIWLNKPLLKAGIFSGWWKKRNSEIGSIDGFEDGQVHTEDVWTWVAENGPRLTAKETGTLIQKPQKTEFFQLPDDSQADYSPKLPDKSLAQPTLVLTCEPAWTSTGYK